MAKLLLAVSVCVLSACLAPRETMAPLEWEHSFLYFEQRSRGVNRSPLELIQQTASPAMQGFTTWLSNNRIQRNNQATEFQDPTMVAQRRTRWALITDAIQRGHIGTSTKGLLVAASSLAEPELSTMRSLVEEENLDRAQCFRILLGHARIRLGSRRATELAQSSAQTWARLDQAAGATLWDTSSSPSNSDNAATTSILRPESRRAQDL